MILTLSLAAGLLAAPEPQAGQRQGWVVELHGYTDHRQAKPKARWIIIDFQWPQPEAAPKVEPVEAPYHDDLSAFFKQLWMQRQGEAIASFYVDDLPAFFKRLKKRGSASAPP